MPGTRLYYVSILALLVFLNGCDNEPYCPEGTSWCWARCVDLQNDNENCGSCDNKCSPGVSCHDGLCQDEGCNTNEQCPEDLCCVDRICVSQDCRDIECGLDPVCNMSCGDCDNESCINGRCVGDCTTRDDCAEPICICINGSCTEPLPVCQGDHHCCSGYRCSFGRCVLEGPGCQSDAACRAINPETPRCRNGMCVPECITNDDCPFPEMFCVDNHCELPPPCTVASCQVGQWCDLSVGACVPGCDEEGDCAAPETCDFANHQCGHECMTDTDCPPYNICVGGWCEHNPCLTEIQALSEEIMGVEQGCTAVIRIERETGEIIAFHMECGPYCVTGEPCGGAELCECNDVGCPSVFNYASLEHEYLYLLEGGEFCGCVAGVSRQTGLLDFMVGEDGFYGCSWFYYPDRWRDAGELGNGCQSNVVVPRVAGYIGNSGNELSEVEIDAAMAVVMDTAVLDAFAIHGNLLSVLVVRYSYQMCWNCPEEWIVLVVGGS